MSAERLRCHEKAAAALHDCSMFVLMQRAGSSAFHYLQQHFPQAKKILVLVGWGNNAGDGYIVATLAKQQGFDVVLACAEPEHQLVGDALLAQHLWLQAGGELQAQQDHSFDDFDVVVDALLGTGICGDIRPMMMAIIQRLNQSATDVLSLDLPSGLHPDTGQGMPVAVMATRTITFVGLKTGLVTGKGVTYCGHLAIDDLGIAQGFAQLSQPVAQLCAWHFLTPLATRPAHANKGNFGRLLCIGGNQGMGGAIRLSAEAALRCGVGLVKVLCHENSQWQVANGRPELMLCKPTLGALKAALDWCTCIVVGPGLGTDDWAQSQLQQVLSYLTQHEKPAVFDADGLNLLTQIKHNQPALTLHNAVITPHPGEASRLLNVSIAQIEQNRYTACQSLADKYGVTAVLKGAGSIICQAQHVAKAEITPVWVCAEGNPGMAVAGMGDVLTGVIGAMMAQGLSTSEAAKYGVCLHAAAGDRVASQYGQRGMIASDLFESLRVLVNNP